MESMKTLRFTAYLLHRYYSKNGYAQSIPYIGVLTSLTIFFFIHIIQIFLIFKMEVLIPTDGDELKPINWLKMFLFMLPLFLILLQVVKKDEVIKANYEETKIKRGYFWLIAYSIASFAFLMFLALLRKGKI
jgi:hypothetical protein